MFSYKTNVEYFKYSGSQITKDVRPTRESKFRIAIAKTEFKQKQTKKTLFTSKFDLRLTKKLAK